MRRPLIFLLIIAVVSIFLLSIFHQEPPKTEARTLRLTCMNQIPKWPCEDYESTDSKVIFAFEQAIAGGEKQPGNVSYIAEYQLDLIGEQETKSYGFGLGPDRTWNGSFVKFTDSSTAYLLDKEVANGLREILGK
ncbi:hypothetical protein [Saccharibacillus sacchari]|uniref:Uncharacterized protein n=1 Tax=Saccharibacillus sacchari TaxID=456493 RepID=A0ACC6P766_9BACL